jgi:hypothetical protein
LTFVFQEHIINNRFNLIKYKKVFLFMSDIFLLGRLTSNQGSVAGYIYYDRVQCVLDGICNKLAVYTGGGNVRAAIYNDISGPLPGTLLAETDSFVGNVQDWTTALIIAPISLVKDLYYWIGVQGYISGGFGTQGGVNGDQAEAWGFGAFPTTATPFANAYGCMAAGYATSAPPATERVIQWNERMVGANHPTLTDTLNRAFLIEHNADGTHK